MPILLLLSGITIVGVGIYQLVKEKYPDVERKPNDQLPPNPRGSFSPNERIVIIGLPGSGKTTLAKKITRKVPRLVCFDPYNDYVDVATKITAEQLVNNPKILDSPTFRYAIVPESTEPEDIVEDVTSIIRAAGDLVVIYDEVGDYNQGKAGDTLKRMARNGRHDGIVSIFVSQVAVDIPLTVRRLASTVYSFRQTHPHDLKALEEVYGEAFANQVKEARLHKVSTWTADLDMTNQAM